MPNLHNFTEYAYAANVVEDFPRILAIYQKLIPALQPHQAYTGVALVLQAVLESQALMQRQLKHYNQVYQTKGKVQAK
jgi:hypothetical protein